MAALQQAAVSLSPPCDNMGTVWARLSVVCAVAAVLLVVHRGREPAAVAPLPAPPTQHAATAVQAGASSTSGVALRLEGEVIDEDDQPVGGATIQLVDPRRSTTSELDGSFAFDGLPAATYALYAICDDACSDDAAAALSATSDPVALRIRRAGSVAVLVVEADGGAPIAGATIGDGRRVATTDAAGRVRLRCLPRQNARFEVSAPDHGPVSVVVAAVDREVARTIVLARGAPVSGIVVDPDGKPVADAEVEIDGRSWRGQVRSDAAGTWRVAGLARGWYAITASSETFGEAEPVSLDVDGIHPRAGITVPVAIGGQIVGSVVDPTGAPIAGARVLADSAAYEQLTATSDATGRFSLLGLPRATFQVWAASGSRSSPRTTVSTRGEPPVEQLRVELRIVLP